MINIENGEIFIENLTYSLNQGVKRKSFEKSYPREFIRDINNINNGYIWFYIWGSIIGKDNIILMSICFNPNDEIDCINIYPHVNQATKLDWADWSEENFLKEKVICDKWLSVNLHLNESNIFSWGSISLYSDNRSGIIMKYKYL